MGGTTQHRVLKFTPEEKKALDTRGAQNPAKLLDRHMDRIFGGLVALQGIQGLITGGMDPGDAYEAITALYMNTAKAIAQGLMQGKDIDIRDLKVEAGGEPR